MGKNILLFYSPLTVLSVLTVHCVKKDFKPDPPEASKTYPAHPAACDPAHPVIPSCPASLSMRLRVSALNFSIAIFSGFRVFPSGRKEFLTCAAPSPASCIALKISGHPRQWQVPPTFSEDFQFPARHS